MAEHPLDVAEYCADMLHQLADMASDSDLPTLTSALRDASIEAALLVLSLEAQAHGEAFALATGFAEVA
jgi:hypothetical protein